MMFRHHGRCSCSQQLQQTRRRTFFLLGLILLITIFFYVREMYTITLSSSSSVSDASTTTKIRARPNKNSNKNSNSNTTTTTTEKEQQQNTTTTTTTTNIEIIEKIYIDQIWSASYADFGFITDYETTQAQYVAYYNSDRRIVIGMRKLNLLEGQGQSHKKGDGEDEDSSSPSSFEKFVLPHPSPQSKQNLPPLKRSYNSVIQGWDAHKYLTLAVDSDGYLHFAGNMHVTPLLYYRMTKLGNISSMEYIPIMVNPKSEKETTYPKFLSTPDGSLLFHYRYRGIGNGIEYYNIYNTQTQTWKRFLNQPLFDDNKRYAYQVGPIYYIPGHLPNHDYDPAKAKKDDNDNDDNDHGWYHLIWMWRLDPGPERNHNISYAKSKDLKHWVTADYDDYYGATGDDDDDDDDNGFGQNGTTTITNDATVSSHILQLPMNVINSRKAVIDPVSSHNGGMINTEHRIGFDSKNRPIISYQKNDIVGNTQACVARYDSLAKSWKISIISSWNYTHILPRKKVVTSSWIHLGTVQQQHHHHDPDPDDKDETSNKHGISSSSSPPPPPPPPESSNKLLALPYKHWKHGNGLLIFDEELLRPIKVVPTIPLRYPMDLYQIKSLNNNITSGEQFPNMVVRWLDDDPNRNRHNVIDTPPLPHKKSTYYYGLRWESLPHNGNNPRDDEPWPPNSELVLYRFKYNYQ